jgi:ABC-type transporter Mla subunit MlaD
VIISIIISGAQRRLVARDEYAVRFPIVHGAPGLRDGATVTLGGQPVGWVISIDFHTPGAVPEAVDVTILVASSIPLYPNALVHLERPLLGTMTTVNIASPGDPSAGPRLQPGAVIPGGMAPPALLAQAGFGPDQAQQLRAMVDQAADIVARINRMTAELETSLEADMGRIRRSLDDIASITADFRQRMPEWTQRIDSMLAQGDRAAARIGPLTEQAETALADAQRVMRDLSDTVESNRERIDRIIANVDEATTRLNLESVPMISRVIGEVGEGIAHFREAGQMFNSLFLEQAPNIRRILANFRLAADQFRLTSVEVRRSPWRLLYQPRTRELEEELFYDAARTYAQAVSDLREASESLEAIARADAVGRVAPTVHVETVEEIQRRLQEAFGRYEEAERELLRQMMQRRR